MSRVYSIRNSVWLFWILVTSIGSMVGFFLAISFIDIAVNTYRVDQLSASWNYPITIAFCALIAFPIGSGQWVVLRPLHRRAALWIIATTIGITAGLYFLFSSSSLVPEKNYPLFLFFSSVIAGLFTGALQWVALHQTLRGAAVWLLVSGLSWGIAMRPNEWIHRWLAQFKMDSLFVDMIIGLIFGFIISAISGAFVAHHLVRPVSPRDSTN